LIQASPKERKLFLETADKHFNNQNLYNRLKKLGEVTATEWNSSHTNEYEQCDKQMINGMLYAEKAARKTKTTAWSPEFAKAVNLKSFWKIALSQKITHTRPSEEFISWANTLGITNFRDINIHEIKRQLRMAQKELRQIELMANELRELHLRDLLTEAELQGDEAKVE
jgi:hypothetical protein